MASGRRRLAAIMVTDMVGWSALAQRDEPLSLARLEEHRALLRPIFARFSGREVKTMGDGFLVEFESALAATECGIEIQRVLISRNRAEDVGPIQVRVGIHVGDVVHQDGDILGDAVNIASRVEPLAEAGGICLSGPVADQVSNKIPFRLLPLEHAFLKNIDSPITVFEVDLPWHSPPAARVTPWTNRDSELELLRRMLSETAKGEGQIVAIGGEAGVGKTRLAEEALRRTKPSSFRVLRGRGFQDVGDAPYAVWAEACSEFLREAPDLLLYKVCSGCSTEAAQLLPQLASRIGSIPAESPTGQTPSQLRFFAGIVQLLHNIAREAPTVLLVDDLQWADSASLRFLEYLAHHLRGQRLLVLVTYRESDLSEGGVFPEIMAELNRSRLVTPLPLKHLDPEAAARLTNGILAAEGFPDELTRQIFGATGGNPFFIEELLRSLIEEGELVRGTEGWRKRSAAELEIPPSVREVVLRRIRRVGEEAFDALSTASVVGSTFRFETVRAVSGTDTERLLPLLERALRARLLRERELTPGEVVYEFGDDQIRNALYSGLSRVRRQTYHLKVAEALAASPAGTSPELASELARHYRLGGSPERALRFYRAAAEHAISVYAHEEAIRCLDLALEVLVQRPDPTVRAQLLETRGDESLALGHPETAVEAWKAALAAYRESSERKRVADMHRRLGYLQRQYFQKNELALQELLRAREILESEPEGVELASLYGDLADLYWYSGQTDRAREMCATALSLAGRVGAHEVEGWVYLLLAGLAPVSEKQRAFDYLGRMRAIGERYELSEVFVGSLHNLSVAYMQIQGDWNSAIRTLEEGIAFARRIRSTPMEMTLRARFLPYVLVNAGQLDRAADLANEMLAYVARYSSTPEPLDLYVLGRIAAVRGEYAVAERQLSTALKILEESPDWTVQMLCLATFGWVRELQGLSDESRSLYRRGSEIASRVGDIALVAQIYSSILFAEVTGSLHQPGVARSTVERHGAELRRIAERVDEEILRAYSYHAEGRIRWQFDGPASGATDLRESVRLWTRVAWPVERLGALLDLGALETDLGEYANALATYREALGVATGLGATKDMERSRASVEQLESRLSGAQDTDPHRYAQTG